MNEKIAHNGIKNIFNHPQMLNLWFETLLSNLSKSNKYFGYELLTCYKKNEEYFKLLNDSVHGALRFQ